jgi:hypothetical protein
VTGGGAVTLTGGGAVTVTVEGGAWVAVVADGVVEVVDGAAVGLGFSSRRCVRPTVIATATTITAMLTATMATMVGHGMDGEPMSCPDGGFCSLP